MAGNLFIIAGPSGVGKSTLEKRLFSDLAGLCYSVSATTRQPRPGETEGRDYFFVSRDKFQAMIDNKELAEWAEFFDNRYGTPVKYVDDCLRKGQDLVIDVEVDGVEQLRQIYPKAVYILIVPPSMAELKRRLSGRRTEDEQALAQRLSRAGYELDKLLNLAVEAEGHLIRGHDYVIVNDDLERAYEELKSVVIAARVSLSNRFQLLEDMVGESL